MVLEETPIPFLEWLPGALLHFLLAGGGLALFSLVVGYLIVAVRYGPAAGGDIVYRTIAKGVSELSQFSLRRIWALARLAVQESIRRRVWIVFAVFALILLFAGWFLDPTSRDPAKLYLSFVYTSTTYLLLLLALFLSTFSIPADIKNRTIYTVVTKPVRAGEIVLGRILGFTVVGTFLLVIMGVSSYVFVVRALDHSHEVDVASLQPIGSGSIPEGWTGRTTLDQQHRHELRLNKDGNGETAPEHGHRHFIEAIKDGDKTRYEVGPPEDIFLARVPVYGKLRFKGPQGQDIDRGISVGAEWGYRSYVEGQSLAAAIWTFEGITEEAFPEGLPIELYIRVFRTYKGDIEKGILGSLVLRNPETDKKTALTPYGSFRAKDFEIDRRFFPRKLVDSDGNQIDLFKDLVHDGKLEVWLQCLEGQQYYGVAQADVYLRSKDALFEANFVKAYVGIWLQMLLVTGFGVMFSTFLSGGVATLATLATLIMGFFTSFVVNLANTVIYRDNLSMLRRDQIIQGGGPIEALIRIVRQDNLVVPLEKAPGIDVAQMLDKAFMYVLRTVVELIPDFRKFDFSAYLVSGFDIPGDLLLTQVVRTLGFLCVVFIAGYLFLNSREVAQ